MKENQLEKREWSKPEMTDLDSEKTANGASPSDPEMSVGQMGYS